MIELENQCVVVVVVVVVGVFVVHLWSVCLGTFLTFLSSGRTFGNVRECFVLSGRCTFLHLNSWVENLAQYFIWRFKQSKAIILFNGLNVKKIGQPFGLKI